MREKKPFRKARFPATHQRLNRNPRQFRHRRQLRLRQREWHESRAWLDDLQPECLRDIVRVPARPHLRNRLAARCDHDRQRPYRALRCRNAEPISLTRDRAGFDAKPQLAARLHEIIQQHVDDLPCRPVAEQLTQRLLMPGDTTRSDARDEIVLRVALEGGDAEMRVLRQELLRRHIQVGEIAPSAAGNADLLGRLVRMVDHHDAAPPAPGFDRAHEAGGPRADDQHIACGCLIAHRLAPGQRHGSAPKLIGRRSAPKTRQLAR